MAKKKKKKRKAARGRAPARKSKARGSARPKKKAVRRKAARRKTRTTKRKATGRKPARRKATRRAAARRKSARPKNKALRRKSAGSKKKSGRGKGARPKKKVGRSNQRGSNRSEKSLRSWLGSFLVLARESERAPVGGIGRNAACRLRRSSDRSPRTRCWLAALRGSEELPSGAYSASRVLSSFGRCTEGLDGDVLSCVGVAHGLRVFRRVVSVGRDLN